ncbi:MAG: hypothetical protein CVU44_13995 [Chloroflexi bacterium HGW-Chloroflexi-6]|nr:MAG: hypothetical protein CVU44_13995 [Chloroflexi bacterium HGW-Chloroflexi-6]
MLNPMKTQMRFKAYILAPLLIVLLILQWRDPSRVWTMLLVTLGGVWLLGWLWARSIFRNTRIMREIRFGWAQVGDRLEERFTVENRGFLPLLNAEIEDHSTMPGYNAGRVTAVGSQDVTTWTTQGICSRRGVYLLGGTTLHSADPFGLYSVSVHDPAQATLMVMPPVVPLPQIEITPGGYLGEGRPRPRAPEQTVGAAGVRAYQPGDPLRMIHWPTSARQGSLFVRTFDGAPAGDWWVLLDLDREILAGSGFDSTEEHAIILAASLADRGLKARQSVGMVINGEPFTWLAPQESPAQRWQILRALALAQPGNVSLANLLERVRSQIGQRASLLIITSSRSSEWLNPLAMLTRKGIIPTVLWLDAETFVHKKLPGGDLPLVLAKHQISCHVITPDLLNRPEAQPGQAGQWEWHTSVTGRVIPIHKPGDLSWRRLG